VKEFHIVCFIIDAKGQKPDTYENVGQHKDLSINQSINQLVYFRQHALILLTFRSHGCYYSVYGSVQIARSQIIINRYQHHHHHHRRRRHEHALNWSIAVSKPSTGFLWPVHTSNKVAENANNKRQQIVAVSGNNAAVFGDYSFGNNLLPFRATIQSPITATKCRRFGQLCCRFGQHSFQSGNNVAVSRNFVAVFGDYIASAKICCRFRQLCC